MLSGQLDGLRKKERLRELFSEQVPGIEQVGLAKLAAVLGSQAGLDEPTAVAYLAEFAAERARAASY